MCMAFVYIRPIRKARHSVHHPENRVSEYDCLDVRDSNLWPLDRQSNAVTSSVRLAALFPLSCVYLSDRG